MNTVGTASFSNHRTSGTQHIINKHIPGSLYRGHPYTTGHLCMPVPAVVKLQTTVLRSLSNFPADDCDELVLHLRRTVAAAASNVIHRCCLHRSKHCWRSRGGGGRCLYYAAVFQATFWWSSWPLDCPRAKKEQ